MQADPFAETWESTETWTAPQAWAPARYRHPAAAEVAPTRPRRRSPAALMGAPVNAVQYRTARPLFAAVGSPLAIMACILAGVWFALPLAIATAWWCTPRTGPWWVWIIHVQAGVVGFAWAIIGSTLLTELPTLTLPIGAGWIAVAGLLAAASAANLKTGSPGY